MSAPARTSSNKEISRNIGGSSSPASARPSSGDENELDIGGSAQPKAGNSEGLHRLLQFRPPQPEKKLKLLVGHQSRLLHGLRTESMISNQLKGITTAEIKLHAIMNNYQPA